MNYSPLQSIILPIYFIAYFIVIVTLFKIYHAAKEERQRLLTPLFIFNSIMFSALVAVITLWHNFSPTITQFITIYGLLTIGVFVVTIEVPGFVLLNNFDKKSVAVLREIKTGMIKSRSTFSEGIEGIHNTLVSNKQILTELHAYDQIDYYETSSNEMNQSNTSIFDLLLMSLNQWMKECEEKSKHPFPKIVDIFSLAGLSFLIAQLLK